MNRGALNSNANSLQTLRDPAKRHRHARTHDLFLLPPHEFAELKVSSLQSGESVIVLLDGHLNALTVSRLESVVDDILATSATRIIFNCSALAFSSSAGLRVFLSSVKRMKARGGSCAFAALTPPFARFLKWQASSRQWKSIPHASRLWVRYFTLCPEAKIEP
jgi:anti-anti-sigma factor